MKQFLYSAVASAALFSSTVFADDAQMLRQQLKGLDSLSSAFSQQVFDPQGQLVSESKGKLQLEQPRKIRWEQQQPDETLFVSNGVDSYYFDPFAEQVTVLDTSKLIDNTPFILLTTEDDELWQQFSIKQIEAGFEITPKNTEDAQVEKLTLHFDEQQQVAALEVLDQSGQRSHFHFDAPKRNVDIDDSVFEFTIPEHVFVDDQRAPQAEINRGE